MSDGVTDIRTDRLVRGGRGAGGAEEV